MKIIKISKLEIIFNIAVKTLKIYLVSINYTMAVT